MAHILAVSNHKGGVGKTTTCFSLAACMADLGYQVLIVDLDSQANLTLAAGLEPEDLDLSLADLLEPSADPNGGFEGLIQATAQKQMDIMPSDPRLASVERALYERDGYETLLQERLQRWIKPYDFVLLDCPPALSALTLMALTAAQDVLVPVQCEYYAAKGLNLLLDVVSAVREHTNPHLGVLMVATLFDPRNKIHTTVLNQMQASFPEELLETVIRVDTRLRECPLVGEPITHYAPRCRASELYRQLAQEIVPRLVQSKSQE